MAAPSEARRLAEIEAGIEAEQLSSTSLVRDPFASENSVAKQIILDSDLGEARFDFNKLDREKVYGRRTRVMLDNDGEPCSRASLTADGSLLIQAGMTAQGYFDQDGTWIENADLVGMQDGQVLDLVPSTLGVSQRLTPASPRELLDTRIYAIYTLEPAELPEALRARLQAGEIFSAPFNYRPDYRVEVSFIVHNDEGFFALVGNRAPPAWVELDLPPSSAVDDEEDDLDDDIDFDMF